MFLKRMMQVGQQTARPKMTLMKQMASRQFSTGQIKPPTSGGTMAPMLMLGGSLAGFAYLAYKMNALNRNKSAFMAQGETYMSPLVQQRLGSTFGWLSYGLLSTAGMVYAMRNSLMWTRIPWFVQLGLSLGCLYGAHACDYQSAFPLKFLFYSGFTGLMGLSVLPLIQVSATAAVADAALATGLSMTTLTAIAYNAPSEQFLNWGGALGMGAAGMFFVGMAGMFWPQSRALYNIWLWGGLGLTGAFTLYHTQSIIYRAKTQQQFDPLGNSIGLYLDAVNFFVRFLMIMGGNKKK